MGVIYSKEEIYTGNFYEGSLEHYGRIIFPNGAIYHGELSNGNFCGQGVYYSPSQNLTTILAGDGN